MKVQECKPGQVIECEPGKVHLVPPDPNMKEMAKDILRQNEMVLKMNADLLLMIAHPVWAITSE